MFIPKDLQERFLTEARKFNDEFMKGLGALNIPSDSEGYNSAKWQLTKKFQVELQTFMIDNDISINEVSDMTIHLDRKNESDFIKNMDTFVRAYINKGVIFVSRCNRCKKLIYTPPKAVREGKVYKTCPKCTEIKELKNSKDELKKRPLLFLKSVYKKLGGKDDISGYISKSDMISKIIAL